MATRTSVAAAKVKLMPSSSEVRMENLIPKVQKTIESFESGVFNATELQPIAFGLKALLVTFALSESQEIDHVQNALEKIEGVSSVELIDYRRAVG